MRTCTMIGLAVLGVTPLAAQDFEWRGRVASGATVEIQGIAGSIVAVRGQGEVEVVATKHGRRSQFGDVTFDVVENEDGVTICAVYPQRRHSRRRNCGPEGLGDVDMDDVDVEVDFEVRVPPGVAFEAKIISGDVRATGLTAEVRAMTVHGNITIETDDVARATTVAGSIRASIGARNWDRDLAFTTVSGDITLELPSDTDADVRMSTLSGDLESQFPMTMSGRGFMRLGVRGVIGQGGPGLKLTTVSGNVTLLRR